MAEISLNGIHFMLPTPFRADETLDPAPYARLVGHAADSGCRGVVCLGVMGEAPRLSDRERSQVVDAVTKAAGTRLTVTVGISSPSVALVAERARSAQEAGAAAVMVAPPRMAKPNEEVLFAYYAAVQQACDLPIVVQDYPLESGVFIDPGFIARLQRELPHARYLKLEDPPTPPKITRILDEVDGKLGIFGGLGGAFLFEELRRGAVGTMTGFAYPEILVDIHRKVEDGHVEEARRVFYKWLPLIRYESQGGIGLSIRKHILKRRGLLDTAVVRRPGPNIDAGTERELDDLLHALGLP